MIQYPTIDPVIVHLWGPLSVRWYGMMYLIGFVAAWWLGRKRAAKSQGLWKAIDIDDLLFYAACGVLFGGRIGYVLFYNFSYFIEHPLSMFAVYDGGMSFHGGLLGVLFAGWLYAKKTQRTFFQIIDFIAPLVPIGLGAGRLGNFINHELPGRISDQPWAMVFPGETLARHPSSLYEFFLEGLVLFALLWWYSSKPRPRFAVSGLFSLTYGLMRFAVEFVRLPDPQLGFIAFNWLTMGQLLCIPMILLGLGLLYIAYRHNHLEKGLNQDERQWLARQKAS